MLKHSQCCTCSICQFVRVPPLSHVADCDCPACLPVKQVCECDMCKAKRGKSTNVGYAHNVAELQGKLAENSGKLRILDEHPDDLGLTGLITLGALCAKVGDYDRVMKVFDALQELVGGKS